MDLYTLTPEFMDNEPVDEFVSAIWTERFTAAGDVQLVVPDSYENRLMLKEGTFLGLVGTKEVMQLETQEMAKGLMTLTGKALPAFLNHRMAWFQHPTSSEEGERVQDYADDTMKPGEFISDIVDRMVINPVPFAGGWAPANLSWDLDKIDSLELGAIDTSGEDQRLTAPIGPLYDTIQQLAEKYNVGISLYLDEADPDVGYTLKFKTYQGLDRTNLQEVNESVRLVPEMDGISDLKEINSLALYKNIAYVYYKGEIHKFLAEPELPEPEGWDRRVLVTDAEGEPVGHKVPYSYSRRGYEGYPITVVDTGDVDAFLEQNARDALANANYIRSVDGQVSSNSEYLFGVHYGLGDLIELEGITGTISIARITEYIRSQDKSGQKNYPTISVVS